MGVDFCDLSEGCLGTSVERPTAARYFDALEFQGHAVVSINKLCEHISLGPSLNSTWPSGWRCARDSWLEST